VLIHTEKRNKRTEKKHFSVGLGELTGKFISPRLKKNISV